jgi:hypothetical protein
MTRRERLALFLFSKPLIPSQAFSCPLEANPKS